MSKTKSIEVQLRYWLSKCSSYTNFVFTHVANEMAENGIYTLILVSNIVCMRVRVSVCVMVLVYYRILYMLTNKIYSILWKRWCWFKWLFLFSSSCSVSLYEYAVYEVDVRLFHYCCLLFSKNACERKSTIDSLCWVNNAYYLLKPNIGTDMQQQNHIHHTKRKEFIWDCDQVIRHFSFVSNTKRSNSCFQSL